MDTAVIAVRHVSLSWQPPNASLSIIARFVTPVNCSRVQVSVLYTTAPDALHCAWWWIQHPWWPIPWRTLCTVLQLIWRQQSLEACSRKPVTSVHCALTLLCGWVVGFDFVKIPLEADCGIFDKEDIYDRPCCIPSSHWSMMFAEAVYMPGFLMEVTGTPEFDDLGEWILLAV